MQGRYALGFIISPLRIAGKTRFVAGAMRAKERAPAGTKYILSGHWASVRDLAAMVEAIARVRAPWLVCPLFLAYIGAPFATTLAHLIGQRPLFTCAALDTLCSNRRISHNWFLLAAALFALLFFITAPYGRHTRRGCGPSIQNKLG